MGLAEPVDELFQAFAEWGAGRIAEFDRRPGDVGKGLVDIARLLRQTPDDWMFPQRFADQIDQLAQLDRGRVPQVVKVKRRAAVDGQHNAFDDVSDVSNSRLVVPSPNIGTGSPFSMSCANLAIARSGRLRGPVGGKEAGDLLPVVHVDRW